MDIWALGCILYEMHVGKTPFFGRSLGDIYLEVQSMQIEFPSSLSHEFISLIESLLQLDPKNRLGASDDHENGYSALKSHPFFAGVNFNATTATGGILETYFQFVPKMPRRANTDI